MRIGIYGGTFNPPHVGHISAAKQAVSALHLDKLLLIPDALAPHKQMPENSPTGFQRLEMLRLGARDVPKAEVSDVELKRDGKSYTYETVLQIQEQYPGADLFLLMGTDMFLCFDSWRNPDVIVKYATIGVFYRGDSGEVVAIREKKKQLEDLGAKVELVENSVLQISSSDLRRMLTFRCADAYLPEGVGEYIRTHGLYDSAISYRNLSDKELEQTVVGLLKPNRVNHVLGCRDMAVALAKHYGADETDACRAALLHDITKVLPHGCQLTLCQEYGRVLDDFYIQNPQVLHALTGSLVAERIFGEKESVVRAVCSHTTGRPNMGLLEKLIYIADLIEPNRTYGEAETLRKLAFVDLDEAMGEALKMTIALLKKQGREICELSAKTLDWLNGDGK